MLVEPLDHDIVSWAKRRRLPCYYADEEGLPRHCLKIQFGHITAYFAEGRLVRLWAHADQDLLDEMFEQLTQLFLLCANRSRRMLDTRIPSIGEGRSLWPEPPNSGGRPWE